jgi:arabinofuranosyltransferase
VPVSKRTGLVLVITLVFVFELVRTAWISDDAAITIRTVLNLLGGFGARFNIDERVQGYTHPLWFLLLNVVTLLTGNVFNATFTLSIVTSALSVAWVLYHSSGQKTMLLASLGFLFSKAFVDFSTSGLENPLSHLIIAFVLSRELAPANDGEPMSVKSFLIVGLSYLSRPDLILIFAPCVVMSVISLQKNKGPVVLSLVVLVIPSALWTVFSIWYYGFPFPNTAYAKLFTGIPVQDRVEQGLSYLIDSIDRDRITLPMVFFGFALGFFKSKWKQRSLLAGGLIYLGYIVSIGGDFMSGRLLTPLLMVSISMISQLYTAHYVLISVTLVLGILNVRNTLASPMSFTNKTLGPTLIADERAFWFQEFGLFNASPERFADQVWQVNDPKIMVWCGGLGFTSLAGGPGLFLIDSCALTDPLLARLPLEQGRQWRIGHYYRSIPPKYVESIQGDNNQIENVELHSLYDDIRIITRANLNDPARLRTIVRLNLGF